MIVETFDGAPEVWDRFVRSQDGWTPFHLYGWRDVLEDIHGHDTLYMVARRPGDGPLEGVLPLIRVKSPVFGHYLVSMPYLNYGGPLGGEDAVAELSREATRMARDEGADLLELRSRKPLVTDLEPSHHKITVVLDLPEGGAKVLWDDHLKSKVRSQVRRPRKEGVEIRMGLDQLEPFHHVFARHMRDLGTPAQPRSLFEAIARAFPENVWFAAAWLEGQPIASGCGFRWEDEFEITWASDLMDYRKIAPNMLLYWALMERSCEEGLSRFNFGRCTPGSGTHRFKKQWGTRDEKLWWYQWSADGVDSTPSPDDRAWSWGPVVWRRLPVSLTKTIGPRIVRYIP